MIDATPESTAQDETPAPDETGTPDGDGQQAELPRIVLQPLGLPPQSLGDGAGVCGPDYCSF